MALQTVQVERRLFTVDEYEQMVRAGVFGEDDGVEPRRSKKRGT